jgi:phosphocarrier protein HPr
LTNEPKRFVNGQAPEKADKRSDRGAMTDQDTARASVLIQNEKGLHARASARFVKCAETFQSDISVTKDGHTVGGTSIMGLLMLAASCGTYIALEAKGADADLALAALTALIESGFGEGLVET